MASKVAAAAQLVIVYAAGVDQNDNPVAKTKTYKALTVDATPEQIIAIGDAITSLQQYPVMAVEQDVTFRVLSE